MTEVGGGGSDVGPAVADVAGTGGDVARGRPGVEQAAQDVEEVEQRVRGAFTCRTANGGLLGGAAAGDDYVAHDGPCFTIPAGRTSATQTVRVYRDTFFEPDEHFFLDIVSAAGTGSVALGIFSGSDTRSQATIVNGSDTCVFVCQREPVS